MKKAYRDLVRKYHPDKYVDNPLADIAAEKMKDINEFLCQDVEEKVSFEESIAILDSIFN